MWVIAMKKCFHMEYRCEVSDHDTSITVTGTPHNCHEIVLLR